MQSFRLILANTLLQNLVNFTVWFALVFWAFLETRSVFVTGMIGGIYLGLTAILAIWFGSVVDHHRKKRVMLASSAMSCALYAVAFALLLAAPPAMFARVDGALLWGFTGVAMLGLMLTVLAFTSKPYRQLSHELSQARA